MSMFASPRRCGRPMVTSQSMRCPKYASNEATPPNPAPTANRKMALCIQRINRSLSGTESDRNKSRVRAKLEHVFGVIEHLRLPQHPLPWFGEEPASAAERPHFPCSIQIRCLRPFS
jgi:hypothetical protein